MRKIKIKNNISVIIYFFLFVFICAPLVSRAETISVSKEIMTRMNSGTEYNFDGLGLKEIFVYDFERLIQMNLKKNINLINQDNVILEKNPNISVGEELTFDISSTYGNWSILGQIQNFGTSHYHSRKHSWIKVTHYMNTLSQVFIPEDDNRFEVVSDNSDVVECINNICESKSNGIANITISFPQKKYTSTTQDTISRNYSFGSYSWTDYFGVSTKGNEFYGSDTGYGKLKIGVYAWRTGNTGGGGSTNNLKNMTYSFPSTTYSITVGTGNAPHETSCSSVTNITESSATINWVYSDADSDIQTQYQVQLSTKPFDDPSFDLITDVRFVGSGANANTDHTFTNLASSTTYYSRIRTYNNINLWSEYTLCGSFTTTGDTTVSPSVPSFTVSCSASPNPVIFPSDTTTFTAITSTTSPTFKWKDSVGTVLGTGSTLLQTYITGQDNIHTLTLDVTKGTETNSTSCSVLVRCNTDHYENKPATTCDMSGQQDVYTCTSEGWDTISRSCVSSEDPTATFTFNPGIVGNISDKCGLVMTASNVSSCSLVSNANTIDLSMYVSSNNINLNNLNIIPVGRYLLSCTGIGTIPVTKTFGTKSCILNPKIREN